MNLWYLFHKIRKLSIEEYNGFLFYLFGLGLISGIDLFLYSMDGKNLALSVQEQHTLVMDVTQKIIVRGNLYEEKKVDKFFNEYIEISTVSIQFFNIFKNTTIVYDIYGNSNVLDEIRLDFLELMKPDILNTYIFS